MQDQIKRSETCVIKDWRTLSLSGVKNIIGFDKNGIAVDTESGKIYIEGNELKINQLSENGEIYVDGIISGIFFAENKPIKKSFLSKLFDK
jgi:sporulation protein YabP